MIAVGHLIIGHKVNDIILVKTIANIKLFSKAFIVKNAVSAFDGGRVSETNLEGVLTRSSPTVLQSVESPGLSTTDKTNRQKSRPVTSQSNLMGCLK